MFKSMKNLRIGTKITIIVAVMMAVTMAVIGTVSLIIASDALFLSYQSGMTTQASETAQVLSLGLQIEKISMREVGEALTEELGDNGGIREALAEQQEELGYAFLSYSAAGGAAVSADGGVLDLSDEAGFQKAMEGQIIIGNPEIWTETGMLYFHAFAPIIGEQGEIEGVTTALIPYEKIYKRISDVKVGLTGYAVLLDETGTTMMHAVQNNVIHKENILIAAGKDAEYTSLKNIVQKCVNRETGFGQCTYLDGTVKYISYAPVPESDWALMLSVPKAELFAPIDQLMLSVSITCAFWFIITIVVILLFVRSKISRPLKKTASFAKELAMGRLDAEVKIRTKDEIGQLLSTLDGEVRQAFITIEKNRAVSEKEKAYTIDMVDKLIVNLERLARGELYCDMAVSASDEDTRGQGMLYTRISENLHLTVNTLKAYIGEISEALGAISAGDMDVVLKENYLGEFVALKNSINSISESLSRVMNEINMSAQQVAAGTAQVSAGSQQISQGASEQASAIEQLTASVEEIAEQTKKNAEKTKKALELASEAQSESATGNEQMKALQQAMTEINESSASISRIIKVIDDIAFQTNILALNAAVEAARAGVHGKGFAVVAEEVRNLAARSASAAKETADLIEGSVKKAEDGNRLADITAGALMNILAGAEESAKFMSEIAEASAQQATGIAQINNGIEQMAQVVQSNSATSQEAAAAAEELSSQAGMLKNLVGKFRLKE